MKSELGHGHRKRRLHAPLFPALTFERKASIDSKNQFICFFIVNEDFVEI